MARQVAAALLLVVVLWMLAGEGVAEGAAGLLRVVVVAGGQCHWEVAAGVEVVGCPQRQAHCWAVRVAKVEVGAVVAELPGCWPSDDSFRAHDLCGACATRHQGSWRRTWSRSWGCALAACVFGKQQGGSRGETGTDPWNVGVGGFVTGFWICGNV